MSKVHSHYENLKVARDAPLEVIRAAYRSLSQKYHPDRNPEDPNATQIMAMLNAAFETLSDPEKRREHDRWIAEVEAVSSSTPEHNGCVRGQAFTIDEDKINQGSTSPPPYSQRSDKNSIFRKAGQFLAHVLRNRVWYGVAALVIIGVLNDKPSAPPSGPKPYVAATEPLPDTSSDVSPVPTPVAKLRSLELGEAILLLMPEKSSKGIDWDFRADAPIIWVTDGYKEETRENGDTVSFREGLIRVHVQGKKAHVLKKNKYELAWTVRYETHTNPKFGVESIGLYPGSQNETCFGTLYDGCDFGVSKSFKQAGISAKKICERSETQQHIIGYQLTFPGKKTTLARLEDNWGSGGTSSTAELMFSVSPSNLCKD